MAVVKEISRGGNVAYYINEEDGVVAARIISDNSDALKVVRSIFDKAYRADETNFPLEFALRNLTYANTLQDEYIGIARCSPEDRFDAEYGKRLALSRAQSEYHADMARLLFKFYDSLYAATQTLYRRAEAEFALSQVDEPTPPEV